MKRIAIILCLLLAGRAAADAGLPALPDARVNRLAWQRMYSDDDLLLLDMDEINCMGTPGVMLGEWWGVPTHDGSVGYHDFILHSGWGPERKPPISLPREAKGER